MRIFHVEIGLCELAVFDDTSMKRSVEVDPLIDTPAPPVVRWKLQAAVETELDVILVFISERRTNVNSADSGLLTVSTPGIDRLLRIWKMLWLINNKEWRTVDTDVAGVAEEGNQAFDEFEVICRQILLGNKYLVIRSVPAASPV